MTSSTPSSRQPDLPTRVRFGQTLLLWCARAGWAHDFPLRWGKAAGFPVVADSTFNRLQHGKIEQPYPITFIQLGLMNQRLASREYGLPEDHALYERLARQQAIADDDGHVWTATDFFSHFIGEKGAPDWALLPDLPSLETAVAASQEAQQRFAALAQDHGLTLPEAWQSLASSVGSSSPALLNREELGTLRDVLSGWHSWTAEELRSLLTTEGENRAGQALDHWTRSL